MLKEKMTPLYPQRTKSHQLEELSERQFCNCLPRNWTCKKPKDDYGVDLIVELFEEDNATGMELLVQLKASQDRTDRDYETIILKTTTYNYLWDKLQVVMLVKYVDEEKKGYWVLLSDVPEPNKENETFTIQVPKQNDLASIDWEQIKDYIKEITYKKLAVRKRHAFGRKKSE